MWKIGRKKKPGHSTAPRGRRQYKAKRLSAFSCAPTLCVRLCGDWTSPPTTNTTPAWVWDGWMLDEEGRGCLHHIIFDDYTFHIFRQTLVFQQHNVKFKRVFHIRWFSCCEQTVGLTEFSHSTRQLNPIRNVLARKGFPCVNVERAGWPCGDGGKRASISGSDSWLSDSSGSYFNSIIVVWIGENWRHWQRSKPLDQLSFGQIRCLKWLKITFLLMNCLYFVIFPSDHQWPFIFGWRRSTAMMLTTLSRPSVRLRSLCAPNTRNTIGAKIRTIVCAMWNPKGCTTQRMWIRL